MGLLAVINQVLFTALFINAVLYFCQFFTPSLLYPQMLLYLMENQKQFTSEIISEFF